MIELINSTEGEDSGKRSSALKPHVSKTKASARTMDEFMQEVRKYMKIRAD